MNLLNTLLTAVISSAVVGAVLGALLLRRNTQIQEAIKLQFAQLGATAASQRQWKERSVTSSRAWRPGVEHGMPHMKGARVAIAVTTVILGACATRPTPVAPDLQLGLEEPVIARFVPETGIFVGEFPVTVSDPHGPGGQLQFVETVVFNRSRGLLVATNRRPNVDHPYADSHVPPGASLTVRAGVGFEPPPPRDELVIMVRVRLTDDREVQRTAELHYAFASAAYYSGWFGDLVKGSAHAGA